MDSREKGLADCWYVSRKSSRMRIFALSDEEVSNDSEFLSLRSGTQGYRLWGHMVHLRGWRGSSKQNKKIKKKDLWLSFHPFTIMFIQPNCLNRVKKINKYNNASKIVAHYDFQTFFKIVHVFSLITYIKNQFTQHLITLQIL